MLENIYVFIAMFIIVMLAVVTVVAKVICIPSQKSAIVEYSTFQPFLVKSYFCPFSNNTYTFCRNHHRSPIGDHFYRRLLNLVGNPLDLIDAHNMI